MVLIRPILKKNPYKLYIGRKPNISHIKVFVCNCFISNNVKENLGKFNAKAYEGIFLKYSLNNHAYRVYNKKFMIVEEYMHIVYNETNHEKYVFSKNDAKEDD